MMRKDIVRMAREARLLRSETIGLDGYITETKPPVKELERFAALVAAHERERLVQVSPLEFVTAVLEKEHLVGKPFMWAQWPNEYFVFPYLDAYQPVQSKAAK